MKRPAKKKNKTPEESTVAAEDPPIVSSVEEALLACMPDAPAVASLHDRQAPNSNLDDVVNQANTGYCPAEKHDEVAQTTLVRASLPLEEAVLACMPGAYHVYDYTEPLHVMLERQEEKPSVSAATSFDVEQEEQQQSVQTSNIVSAYRVPEEEPPVTATPFKDKKVRFLIYGVLVTAVVAIIVGLSVGLTTKNNESADEEQTSDSLGHLVSSVLISDDKVSSFVKAKRYIRTENGKEIVTTIGSAVVNWCEVVPCIQGGCHLSMGKVYEPGCCLGDDCSPSDKCGYSCPRRPDLCYPSFDGCRDASCFECESGPDGEELYRYQDAAFNINCLRTGVAIGFNDKDDNVERIYKWAVCCGVNVHGGNEFENSAPGEYMCAAARIGDGITNTISRLVPCQLIQLGECGCAPDDVHTFGLFPHPEKPCKTKEDCPYLCGDAGEEEAKTLCDAFPGIEWWEGENPLYQSFFMKPTELSFGNATIQIDIHG